MSVTAHSGVESRTGVGARVSVLVLLSSFSLSEAKSTAIKCDITLTSEHHDNLHSHPISHPFTHQYSKLWIKEQGLVSFYCETNCFLLWDLKGCTMYSHNTVTTPVTPSTHCCHTAQHHIQQHLMSMRRDEIAELHSICSPPLSAAVVRVSSVSGCFLSWC